MCRIEDVHRIVGPSIAVPLLLGVSACSDDPAPAAEIVATPLAARTARTGEAPRFTRLDPAVSGLDFAHELRHENAVPYVYSGSGVAVGDYDADGLPDVYLVSQDGPNRLFRQVAPLRFEDVTAAAGDGLDGGDAWGTAATFGDVDGDGDLDLYVCNTESPNLLFQNRGDGTFREVAGTFGLAVTAACTGASFADYDNDGDLDLYVLTDRVFAPRLPEQIVREVALPSAIQKTHDELFPSFPQFEVRDGRPVVPDEYRDFFFVLEDQLFTAGQRDFLFRNDGYAKWTDVTEAAGIDDQGMGLSATWWDYDDDGWLDLYVANDLESPDQLYRNRGDGSFEDVTKQALPSTAYYGMGSDFGDIDNDGRLDFCVADMSSTSHYMSKMLMGMMSDRRWFLENADPPQQMRNAVYLNTGTERFAEAGWLTGLASTDWTWTVRFADLDDDGWLDFYATNGIPRFDNDPDAAAEFRRLWRQGIRDEALDVARNLQPVQERNIARRNRGDGLAFEDVSAAWGLADAGVSNGAALADLDRDGDLDIIVNNFNAPAALYENRGHGAHRALVELRASAESGENAFGVGARVTIEAGGMTQTRLVVPTRGYMSAGEPVVHFGLGAATSIDRLRVRWPSGREQEFLDLPADHRFTIAATGPAAADAEAAADDDVRWFASTDDVAVRHAERAFDDYAIQPLLPHRLSQLGPGIAWSDVNGDAIDDAWIGGAAGQAGTLLLGSPPTADGGRRSYRPHAGPWRDDAEAEDLGAVFLDHDRDGDLDLFVVSGSVEAGDDDALYRDRLYVNDGVGGFVRAPADALPDRRASGSCVCAADFDRDGDVDLFVGGHSVPGRYPEPSPSALLRNDDGRFVDATAELAPELRTVGMVAGATWADVDGDGWPDLVVASRWQPLRLFTNRDGSALRSPADAALPPSRGLWNGVTAADLDADGDLDLVVTNLGLNTKYKADANHPLRVYARDFDGNGVLDVIEAKYEGDTLLPVRGRSCSTSAMPFLGEQFRTFDAFARASLPDIYGMNALEDSLELRVDELRHVVLENVGDGTFGPPRPLPRAAQIAPAFGIGVADFDGDGHVDLALAQNFYSPEPETGRMAGGVGLVLAGRPGLEFEPRRAVDSGVVLPEDAMGLATTDLDGDAHPDFVATANDASTRSFVNRVNARNRTLAVRLLGPPGNPSGIGARIELRDADGSRHRVLTAGDGYLTQRAPIAFFPAAAPTTRRPEAATPPRLVVTWPDGERTERELPANSHGLLVVER